MIERQIDPSCGMALSNRSGHALGEALMVSAALTKPDLLGARTKAYPRSDADGSNRSLNCPGARHVCVYRKLKPGRNDGEPAEGLKPALRLERRGQHGQNKTDKRGHRANLADSSLNQPG